MKLLKLIVYPDPILRAVCKPVESVDGSIVALKPFADELVRAMHAYDGVAIAAPQVGASIRVIAINQGAAGTGKGFAPLVLVNPVLKVSSPEGEVGEEGCLSFPGVRVRVNRPKSITVDYTAMDGEVVTSHAFTGILARAVTHEIEHLDGVLLIDHIDGRVRRDMVARKAAKAKKRGVRPRLMPGERP